MSIEEGNPAPAFTLPDQHGNNKSLSDYAGKNLIVYFYPRDDTPGCTKEACGFRDLWADIQATGAEVIGISPDKPEKHQAFIEKYQLPFTLLCDPDKTMMSEWDAFGEKIMYGKKTQGVIRSSVWVDPNGIVKKHWRRIQKAADHPAKVLEALNESE